MVPPNGIAARRAAERWFLDHGLPAVLAPRARLRAVWPRSARALAGLATLAACGLLIYLLVGQNIDIEGEPTTTEWFVLAILTLALPLGALVGWIVSRLAADRTKAVVAAVSRRRWRSGPRPSTVACSR